MNIKLSDDEEESEIELPNWADYQGPGPKITEHELEIW